MKRIVTEAEVEQRVAAEQAKMAKRGLSLPVDVLRAFSRSHLEMTAPRAVPTVRQPTPVVSCPTKPLARSYAAAKRVVPSYLAAERARISQIIVAAPAGAEAERDEAIANGASVETFCGTLAGRTILDARRRAGG